MNPNPLPDDPTTNTPAENTEAKDGHCGTTPTKFVVYPLPWWSGHGTAAGLPALYRAEKRALGVPLDESDYED